MDRRTAIGLALLIGAGCATEEAPPGAIAVAEPTQVASPGSTSSGLASPIRLGLWDAQLEPEGPAPSLEAPLRLEPTGWSQSARWSPATRLVGRVVTTDGEPLPGAEVRIGRRERGDERTLLTGPDGGFEVQGLPEGVRRMSVRRDGHRRRTSTVVLVNGREVEVEVRLARVRALEVVIRGPDGQPAAGARAWDVLNPTNFDRRSDENGALTVNALVSGPLTLLVDHRGAWERCELGPVEALRDPVTVSLTGVAMRLVGRIVGPIQPGLSVEARRAESLYPGGTGGFRRAGSIDERGRFAIASIDSGTYELVAVRDGLRVAAVPEIVVKRAPVQVDVFLPEPGLLSGRVVDQDGYPVDGAPVTLEQAGGGRIRSRSGPDGVFRFEGLPPGAWWLRADSSARHHGVTSARFELQEGQVMDDLRLVLRPPARVRARLLAPDAAPIPGGRIRLRDGDRCLVGEAETGPQGAFRLGVAAGRYRIELEEETLAVLAARLGVTPDSLRVTPGQVEVHAGSVVDLDVRIER